MDIRASCLQVEAFQEAGLPKPLAIMAAELVVRAEEMYGHLLSLHDEIEHPRKESIAVLIEHFEPLPRRLTEIFISTTTEIPEMA